MKKLIVFECIVSDTRIRLAIKSEELRDVYEGFMIWGHAGTGFFSYEVLNKLVPFSTTTCASQDLKFPCISFKYLTSARVKKFSKLIEKRIREDNESKIVCILDGDEECKSTGFRPLFISK